MQRADGTLTAGAAEITITPPIGTPAVGTIQRSNGVHDDLCAHALVLNDGQKRVAILSLDLIGMDFALADRTRLEIRARTGITDIFVHCTHNHSAPFTIPWSVLGPRWPPGPQQAWHDELAPKLAELVELADGRSEPAALRTGRATVRIGTNRRLQSDLGVVMKPNASGPVVPWVDVLCVDRADGRPLALLFSHAAHPVIIHGSSRLISAEFPGFAARRLKERLGTDVVVLFGQGCGADINADPLRGGIAAAERAGDILAEAALEAASNTADIAPRRFTLSSAHAYLPLQALPSRTECADVLREAERRLVETYGGTPFRDEELWDMLDASEVPVSSAASQAANDVQPMEGKAWWMVDTMLCLRDLLAKIDARDEQPLRFDAQMLRIGDDWSLIAATHELFAEYQLRLDREVPTRHRVMLAYTNGCESYIPMDRDLALGGYEAGTFPDLSGASLRYRHRRALAPGFEQLVIDQLRSLWLTPGKPAASAASV
jgi:hypothetical protein